MVTFQEQNNELVRNFLDRTFFKAWKYTTEQRPSNYCNFSTLELILNYECNLNCKYCYVARHGKELYDPSLYKDTTKLLANLDQLLDWLLKNNYSPRLEIFGGESLQQEIGFEALNMILDKLSNKIKTTIVIPTNFTWIMDEEKTERVESLLSKSREVNIPIRLSSSVDGKYCDVNRPFKDKSYKRTDEYYDKCFVFLSRWQFGFHPMIYSNAIEKWKDNFLWIQDMFKKHGIHWSNIYLLEVRNSEWNEYQNYQLYKFMKFLVKWSYNRVQRDKVDFIKFMMKNKGFNILSNPFVTVGRGMGCSMQSTMSLRLGDMALVPCHRTSYKPFILGYLNPIKDEILVKNMELFITKHTIDANSFPYCESCPIREICPKGCLGAQLETTGDMFTPVPSVCRMEHARLIGIIEGLYEINMLSDIMSIVKDKKRYAIKELIRINDETRGSM